MTSHNEIRVAENITVSAIDVSLRLSDHPLPRIGNPLVRSSPDAAERNRLIALGLDPTFPIPARANFVSSENIARVQHLLISDAHYIQHGAIRQLPELVQPPLYRNQQLQQAESVRRRGPPAIQNQSSTMADPGSSDQGRVGGFGQPPPGFRDALVDSETIVAAMAILEKRTKTQEDKEDPPVSVKSYDSAVDDASTFPVLPSVSRRQSEQLDRRAGSSLLGKWSLPDLHRIQETFIQIASMEGVTDPELILLILVRYPEIDYLYLSPILKPGEASYSPYFMHLVHPGRVDILNCCVVTKKSVIRYIKGKEPRCLSLKRWSFEQNVMFKMRAISFFKHFKLIKAFNALGQHLDMRRFGKTKRKLRRDLMTCNPNYSETLLLVRTMCLDMAALSLIHVDAELTYTLGEFMEDQDQHAHDILTKLERYMAILLHLVSRMCWDDVIGAGLAEESRGRRGGAPKRVNELRKMQRLRQNTSGSRQSTDDVNIGMWIKSPDLVEFEEMESRRKIRCLKLFRFIYLVDCLIRDALHQVFDSSLKTSANYLILQLQTFPSDAEISAIVKGYVGELENLNMFSNNDSNDDGGGGNNPSGRHKPDDGTKKLNQPDGGIDGKKWGKEKSDEHATTNILPVVPGKLDDATGISRSRLSTDMDVSTTWTTLRMSSSAERFGTDTAWNGTPSTLDNAVYSLAHGEADLTDSIQTTSSTLSDDQVNANPMSAFDLYHVQGPENDDFNLPVIIGSNMRIFRVHGIHTQNQHTNTAGEQAASVEQEMDMDDVTVIERLGDIQLNRDIVKLQEFPREKRNSPENHLEQSYLDDTEEDLTITSDDKSSLSNRRKNIQSNNVICVAPVIAQSVQFGKSSKKQSETPSGRKILRTSGRQMTGAASEMLAPVRTLQQTSKKELAVCVLVSQLEEALTKLQEQRETLESDSSASTCALLNETAQPEKVRRSLSESLYLPLADTIRSTADKLNNSDDDERSFQINNKTPPTYDTAVVEDINNCITTTSQVLPVHRDTSVRDTQVYQYYSVKGTRCCESIVVNDSEEYSRAQPPRVPIKDQCASAQVPSSTIDNNVKDAGPSGIFGGLFTRNIESSVDLVSDAAEEHRTPVLRFPFLGKASWVSDYFGSYSGVKNYISSSVDINGLSVPKVLSRKMSTENNHIENKNSIEVLVQAEEHVELVRRESNDSVDDVEQSADSARHDSKDPVPEADNTQGRDRNVCNHKSMDEVQPETNKPDEVENTAERQTQNEDRTGADSTGAIILAVTEYQSKIVENATSEENRYYTLVGTPDATNETTVENNEENFLFYLNPNTSPSIEEEEEEDRFKPADFFMNDESHEFFTTFRTINMLREVSDPDIALLEDVSANDASPGVRKDGGKRRKTGKSSQDGETSHVSTQESVNNYANDLTVEEDNEELVQEESVKTNEIVTSQKRSPFLENQNKTKNKVLTSYSMPCVQSENSSSAMTIQQFANNQPNGPDLLKIVISKIPIYERQQRHTSDTQDIHYNSLNSSIAKSSDSDHTMSIADEDNDGINQLDVPSVIEEKTEEEIKENDISLVNENDTENDLTDGVLESTTRDEKTEFVDLVDVFDKESKIRTDHVSEKPSVVAGAEDNSLRMWDDGKDQAQMQSRDGVEEKLEDHDGRGIRQGGAGGSGGGGGGGGGSSGYNSAAKKRFVPDLKPMFHASLSINRELVCMTPDIYDFTAASFNIVHEMEVRLLSIESLTSNPAFLTFAQPSADGQSSVDKRPKGPTLERVIRVDPSVTNLKNSIYSSIDDMFHSVAVYTKEMQSLYLKYFQDRNVDFDVEPKDVEFYCKHLQRYDVQLKIVDRLPESQRLGLFLIDLTPYKEFVRQCSVGSLQQLQLELNADVVHRTRILIEKLSELHIILENKPTSLVPLFRRLSTMDAIHELLKHMEQTDISHIGALYNVIDRFDVPHTQVDRRAFESTHYLITSARHTGMASLHDRHNVVDAILKCLTRDIRYLHIQVKKMVRPLVESELYLEGSSNPREVRKSLKETEDVIQTHVAMANFVREVQRYLEIPETKFTELFHLSSRYVNTRNIWLLMADWDSKLEKWKHQNFQTLDMQEINTYTFKYMEACDKLEKLLPKNTVISVFEEKMDIMLRWLNFIIEFRGQAVKQRHWVQIEEILGVEFGDQLPLTLASLMSINAIDKQKNLHVILNKARAESNVQHEFDEVVNQCRSLTLPVQSRQKSLLEGEEPVTVNLLGDTFEIEESLNYFVMELERIDLSPHSGFLHTFLEEYVQSIFEVLEKLVQWMEMQMKLSRLRRFIVRHPEVLETLQAEVDRYKYIYMAHSQFLATVMPEPNVMRWCASQELHDIMEAHQDEILRLYRVFKRDIEVRGVQDNQQHEAQRQFGTWVVM